MAKTRGAREHMTLEECTIEATVPTGFEEVAAEEAKEIFCTQCKCTQGKITFQTPRQMAKRVLELGGVDNCRVQILHIPHFGFTSDAEDSLSRLQLLVKDCNWAEGLEMWKKFFPFADVIPTRPDTIPTDRDLINVCYSAHMPGSELPCVETKLSQLEERPLCLKSAPSKITHATEESSADTVLRRQQNTSLSSQNTLLRSGHMTNITDPAKPKFRVTCRRAGDSHSFDSTSAAASFGSAVQRYFGWQVDLNNFDIEIVLNIDNREVSGAIALTSASLHRRDMVAFGITTLRATVAYNMLRLVDIQPGHIVCDPLCGSGAIPIQGAERFGGLQLCGDNHAAAMKKSQCNQHALNERRRASGRGGLMMEALQWNACSLPLRDGTVDAFVSDLPFGKRVGRPSENLGLYNKVLVEMARCSKPAGRAALLTADMKNMSKAIKLQRHWSRQRCYPCSISGLAAAVFLLHRNT